MTKVISDYNGYDYKKLFWETGDREYEDAADRMALRKLMVPGMTKFVDVAGGYGRLTDESFPFAEKPVLFDYSKTELAQAKEKYGDRVKTVAGDVYNMPFEDGEFDGLMMIRATHHFADMQKVSDELYRILKDGGVAIIEVANKRTLPRMVRFLTGKSKVNPFSREPANLTEIDKDGFYNYHPKYIEEIFRKSGFTIDKVLSVSNFRNAKLKKLFGADRLIKMEGAVQGVLAPVRFAPSIYYRLKK